MTTTYTPSLRLALPGTGDLDGTWGTTVNTSITSLVDSAIAGYKAITMTDANYTLTSSNGIADEARSMYINMSGTLTAARNVVCPAVSKLYFFKNSTTGGYALTLKTSGGTGISVPNGQTAVLFCDGTNVIDATTYFSSATIGTLSLANALGVANGGTGRTTLTPGYLLAGNGTGQVGLVATGNTGQVLTMSGGNWAPATPAKPETIIQQITTVGGSALNIDIPSGYNRVSVEVYNTYPNSGSNVQLRMIVSTDGGSNFLSTGYYFGVGRTSGDAYTYTNNANTTSFGFATDGMDASDLGAYGGGTTVIDFIAPYNNGVNRKIVRARTDQFTSMRLSSYMMSGLVTSATQINAIQLYWASGTTFSSGTSYIVRGVPV